jgi:hypothetical protein
MVDIPIGRSHDIPQLTGVGRQQCDIHHTLLNKKTYTPNMDTILILIRLILK